MKRFPIFGTLGIATLSVMLLSACTEDDSITLYYARCANGLDIKPSNLFGKTSPGETTPSFKSFTDDWEKNDKARDACELLPWSNTDYKINFIKSEVYRRRSMPVHLEKLTDCAIEDKNNWVCKSGRDTIMVVKDGLESLPKENWEYEKARFSVNAFTYWFATFYWFVFSKGPKMGKFISVQNDAIDSQDSKYFLDRK